MPLSHLPRLSGHLPSPPGPLARPPHRRSACPCCCAASSLPRPPHRHLLVPRRRHHRRLPPGLHHHLRLSAGRLSQPGRLALLPAVKPVLAGPSGLLVAIDDTPTARYGPEVEGAGIHHNPSPGPPARSSSTATSGSPWPPWPSTPTGVRSPCPCRHSCTSARPIGQDWPPIAAAPSAPNWNWPPSSCAGLNPGWTAASRNVWVVVDGGLRQAAVPAAGPAGRLHGGQPPAQGRGLVVLPAQDAAPERAARQADLRQGADSSWPSGPGRSGAGNRWSACSTARQVTKTIKTFLATWRPAGG